jgi:hypothetical protein
MKFDIFSGKSRCWKWLEKLPPRPVHLSPPFIIDIRPIRSHQTSERSTKHHAKMNINLVSIQMHLLQPVAQASSVLCLIITWTSSNVCTTYAWTSFRFEELELLLTWLGRLKWLTRLFTSLKWFLRKIDRIVLKFACCPLGGCFHENCGEIIEFVWTVGRFSGLLFEFDVYFGVDWGNKSNEFNALSDMGVKNGFKFHGNGLKRIEVSCTLIKL